MAQQQLTYDEVDSIHEVIRASSGADSRQKAGMFDSLYQVLEVQGDVCAQVATRIRQSSHLDDAGLADSALALLYWADSAYHEKCDPRLRLNLLINLSSVYLSFQELGLVDSVVDLFHEAWNPEWQEVELISAILNNEGIALAMRGEFDAATATFYSAYQKAKASNDVRYVQRSLVNLGAIKGVIEELDSAYYYFNEAAKHAQESQDLDNLMSIVINMANVHVEAGDNRAALVMIDSAEHMAVRLNNLEKLAYVYDIKSDIYARQGRFETAYDTLRAYVDVRETFLDAERIKAVAEMMERYESERKARQIQQLELENLDSEIEKQRLKNWRNRVIFFGIGLLLVALALWSRLSLVRRSRAEIQKEKDISEGLLLNILPASVAEELKLKGSAQAQHFDTATILFSDFKDFTAISEQLEPDELVESINMYFKKFDEIVSKHGLEKIKTIGDSYMAAGGLPAGSKATTLDVVNAGLEMQVFVEELKEKSIEQGKPVFEMRVGIHTGPVVAGIVGVKKFQYDLWGDTVNIASRMESSGEVGKVNISDATYGEVKDEANLRFPIAR